MNIFFATSEAVVLLINLITLGICLITAYAIYVDKKRTWFHSVIIIILIWAFWGAIANIIEMLML